LLHNYAFSRLLCHLLRTQNC